MEDQEQNCPHCNKIIKVPEEFLGQTVECPHCQRDIEIAAPAADHPGAMAPIITEQVSSGDNQATTKVRGEKWLWIITNVFLPLNVLGCIIRLFTNTDNAVSVITSLLDLLMVVAVFWGLRKRTAWGWWLVIAYIVLTSVALVYAKYMEEVDSFALASKFRALDGLPPLQAHTGAYVLLGIAVFCLIGIPNLIYFYHRRRRFGVKFDLVIPTIPDSVQEKATPTPQPPQVAAQRLPATQPAVASTTIVPDAEDRELYAQAFREAQDESAGRDSGVWAMAFSQTGGDIARCQAEYVRYRVGMLKTERQHQAQSAAGDQGERVPHNSFKISHITKETRIKIALSTGVIIVVVIGTIFAFRPSALTQYNRGRSYATGAGVKQNDSEAIRWFQKAADRGLAQAQYSLGNMYAAGRGVPKNEADAVYWYQKAAYQGYAPAQNHMGVEYEYGIGVSKDAAEAVRWYRQAADQGNAQAQCNLGEMYAEGNGVSQDDIAAVRCYQKAAEQGHARAEEKLARAYGDGRGVAKDPDAYRKWMRSAADHGDANAQYTIALQFMAGIGVSRDPSESDRWLRKAANGGCADAQYMLGSRLFCAENSTPETRREAAQWYRKAADQNHAAAAFALSFMYKDGSDIPKDEEEALNWCRRGATLGDANAQHELGRSYYSGDIVPKDRDKAFYWLSKAASQGNAAAQFLLGSMYAIGEDIPQNDQMALELWRKAAAQGNEFAISALKKAGLYTNRKTP